MSCGHYGDRSIRPIFYFNGLFRQFCHFPSIIFPELSGILNISLFEEKVKVIIEEDWRDAHDDVPVATELEGLAGDNLRSLLMHRHLRLYDDRTVRLDTLGTGDCGGEGICGTCLVEVLEGMEALNKKGPQESESK